MITKEEIRIKNIIVHILDATVGMPVLSDTELEYGSDFADFIREHLAKLTVGDDMKACEFYQKESEIYSLVLLFGLSFNRSHPDRNRDFDHYPQGQLLEGYFKQVQYHQIRSLQIQIQPWLT